MSGRAFPAGDHVSGVSGAVCANPPTLLPLGILHHGTDCAACTPRGQGSAQGCFLCHTKQGAQSLSPLGHLLPAAQQLSPTVQGTAGRG